MRIAQCRMHTGETNFTQNSTSLATVAFSRERKKKYNEKRTVETPVD